MYLNRLLRIYTTYKVKLQIYNVCLERGCKHSNSFVEMPQETQSQLSFLRFLGCGEGRMSKIQMKTRKHTRVRLSLLLNFPIHNADTKER